MLEKHIFGRKRNIIFVEEYCILKSDIFMIWLNVRGCGCSELHFDRFSRGLTYEKCKYFIDWRSQLKTHFLYRVVVILIKV